MFYLSQDVYVILVDLSNNLAGNKGLNIVQSWLIRPLNVIQKVNVWDRNMANKLGQGDAFPHLTLNLVGGERIDLPENLNAKYNVILFYRGHW